MIKADVATIILAAGESKRLGKPKQLLPYKNTTLLGNSINAATESGLTNILIVLGSNFLKISQSIKCKSIRQIINTKWKEGMGSSLSTGMKTVLNEEAVLIMLCDQPKITSKHISSLIDNYQPGKIIGSTYDGILGVPALFPKKYFEHLAGLSGDQGAKKIIEQFSENVISVECPEGAIDIDIKADLVNLE